MTDPKAKVATRHQFMPVAQGMNILSNSLELVQISSSTNLTNAAVISLHVHATRRKVDNTSFEH
jgi:hypothetical protein